MLIFYRSRAGWEVVERAEYPSFVLTDEGEITVEKIERINDHWMLILSDTTVEFLHWTNVVINELVIEKVWIKNNQLTATFSREASEKMNELCMEKLGSELDWDNPPSDEELFRLLNQKVTEPSIDLDQIYDFIIVGSGPNGAAAAKRLVEAGKSVLMIESGKCPR